MWICFDLENERGRYDWIGIRGILRGLRGRLGLGLLLFQVNPLADGQFQPSHIVDEGESWALPQQIDIDGLLWREELSISWRVGVVYSHR